MNEDVLGRPSIPAELAAQIAHEWFGITCDPEELPSERDRNFRLKCPDGHFVLKVSHPNAERSVLELQNAAMLHVAAHAVHFQVPTPITSNGNDVFEAEDENGKRCVTRLVSYCEGIPFANFSPHSRSILFELGQAVGELTQWLTAFDHPAAYRELQWDLKNAENEILKRVELIADSSRRDLLLRQFHRTLPIVKSCQHELRESVIHNDVNDYNVIVQAALTASDVRLGIIDFGDMLYSHTVNELAICLAYVYLNQDDPIHSAARVVAGFHSKFQLEELELKALFSL